mgnify:CR=1 FL=1
MSHAFGAECGELVAPKLGVPNSHVVFPVGEGIGVQSPPFISKSLQYERETG